MTHWSWQWIVVASIVAYLVVAFRCVRITYAILEPHPDPHEDPIDRGFTVGFAGFLALIWPIGLVVWGLGRTALRGRAAEGAE